MSAHRAGLAPTGLQHVVHAARAARGQSVARFVQEPLGIDLEPRRDRSGPPPQVEAAAWAGQIGQVLAEVMTGGRPLHQLGRWVSPEVYASVARRHAVALRRLPAGRRAIRARVRVLRVRVCEPAPGVAEAAIVLTDTIRSRALALRLVARDGRWVVTELEVG
jgi:hypothetical protein